MTLRGEAGRNEIHEPGPGIGSHSIHEREGIGRGAVWTRKNNQVGVESAL